MFGPELNQTFCDLSELFQSCLLALMGHDSRPQMQAAGCPKKVIGTLENCKHQRHLNSDYNMFYCWGFKASVPAIFVAPCGLYHELLNWNTFTCDLYINKTYYL